MSRPGPRTLVVAVLLGMVPAHGRADAPVTDTARFAAFAPPAPRPAATGGAPLRLSFTPATQDDERPPPVDTSSPADLPAAEDDSLFKQWWFWVGAGVVVTGIALIAASAIDSGEAEPAKGCPPTVLACFGDGRTR